VVGVSRPGLHGAFGEAVLAGRSEAGSVISWMVDRPGNEQFKICKLDDPNRSAAIGSTLGLDYRSGA
jgi:hypothetical protein